VIVFKIAPGEVGANDSSLLGIACFKMLCHAGSEADRFLVNTDFHGNGCLFELGRSDKRYEKSILLV